MMIFQPYFDFEQFFTIQLFDGKSNYSVDNATLDSESLWKSLGERLIPLWNISALVVVEY